MSSKECLSTENRSNTKIPSAETQTLQLHT